MIPLIIGGVTLAVVGYAIKEVCEEEGCPWDSKTSTFEKTEEAETVMNSKKAKDFHKFKKNIYKVSMQEYQEFLEKHNLQNDDITTDLKLEKQKLSDEMITDEIESYINQISNTLEILSYNLSLGIKMMQNEKSLEDEVVQKLNSYANSIYNLSHLKLFDQWSRVNQVEILSVLVKAMGEATQKDTIHVDLDAA